MNVIFEWVRRGRVGMRDEREEAKSFYFSSGCTVSPTIAFFASFTVLLKNCPAERKLENIMFLLI